jgi:coenzyme F420-reducing hydrogenase gamma subunit
MDRTPFAAGKTRIAVHKFSSCDGCQLAFLNLGDALLALADGVDFVHFAEAGPYDPDAAADIAFVEGSISVPEDIERIARIRAQSGWLVAIGACAVSGGVQALRNDAPADWRPALYPQPETIVSLARSTPLSAHVRVDAELCGCPVTARQVLGVIAAFCLHSVPRADTDKVCTECKRRGLPCVLVSKAVPCLGPVTRAGCGALCPGVGRDCYGCFGPAETANTDALAARFADLGLSADAIVRRFAGINSQAPAFRQAAQRARGETDG